MVLGRKLTSRSRTAFKLRDTQVLQSVLTAILLQFKARYRQEDLLILRHYTFHTESYLDLLSSAMVSYYIPCNVE